MPGVGLSSHRRPIWKSPKPRCGMMRDSRDWASGSYFRLHGELRRILVNRFPYALMFRDTDTELMIVSCFHLHDDPDVWQSRG